MSDQVFVIDDDPSMLRLITVVLKTEGFRVAPFESAVAALVEIADPSEPNPLAVILDLNMPEMDGREFYRQARVVGLTSPVLILSAYGAEAARRELGAEAAMSKPFDGDAFASTVRQLLANGRD